MDETQQMSLAALRGAIKQFKKESPKLTGKKADLMAYANRIGLFKKPDVVEAEPPAAKKVAVAAKKVVEALPESLKKPVAKPVEKKAKAVVAPAKKAATSFAAFMSEHKGQGFSMKDLALKYKESK